MEAIAEKRLGCQLIRLATKAATPQRPQCFVRELTRTCEWRSWVTRRQSPTTGTSMLTTRASAKPWSPLRHWLIRQRLHRGSLPSVKRMT